MFLMRCDLCIISSRHIEVAFLNGMSRDATTKMYRWPMSTHSRISVRINTRVGECSRAGDAKTEKMADKKNWDATNGGRHCRLNFLHALLIFIEIITECLSKNSIPISAERMCSNQTVPTNDFFLSLFRIKGWRGAREIQRFVFFVLFCGICLQVLFGRLLENTVFEWLLSLQI